MASQEFLASFAVDIDESGVSRLKLLLEGIAWSLSGFFGGGRSKPETAPADTAP